MMTELPCMPVFLFREILSVVAAQVFRGALGDCRIQRLYQTYYHAILLILEIPVSIEFQISENMIAGPAISANHTQHTP
jgi:hypothetical protein